MQELIQIRFVESSYNHVVENDLSFYTLHWTLKNSHIMQSNGQVGEAWRQKSRYSGFLSDQAYLYILKVGESSKTVPERQIS